MKLALWIAGAALAAGIAVRAQAPADDPVLQAMHDEVERSRKLALSSLETPYFIQYVMDQSDSFDLDATLGGIVSRRRDQFRNLDVQIRVGDYKFDNSNYVGSDYPFGTRYDLGRVPLDNNYGVLRRYFWLATDSAYKSAVEAISRKRAALRNLSNTTKIDDFAHAEPVHLIQPFRALTIDEKAWTDRIRTLSAIFDRYPDLRSTSVELSAGEGGYYIVNTEGTEIKVPDGLSYVRARASAQASDGMTVRDTAMFHAIQIAQLPDQAAMTRAIESMAQNVTALAHAPKGDDYSGPVLFEGVAGPQIVAELLGKNLALPRRPVLEPGRNGGFTTSELEGRIGARVLPDSFDVVDDPTAREWRGHSLFGFYQVDREGVVPKPLHLVEKGLLKGYLLTRQPVRGFEGSNGRARMPGSYGADAAGVSNLLVTTSDTTPVNDLKKKLLDLIAARSKDYGIIIRKMDFPSSASVPEARRLLAGAESGSSRPVSLPLLAYRVYPDGHEELVRGLRFRGLNSRSLRDVVAAGDDSVQFDFLDNQAPYDLMGGSGYIANATVIAPSLLIDDLELHPLEDELPNLPVVPPPELSR